MDFIIKFYKELDILNLIIFWGVIIVILLLLIFSIIIANKNKKLNNIIKNNIKSKDDNNADMVQDIEIPITTDEIEIPQESFKAEEHIIEYNPVLEENKKDQNYPNELVKNENELKEEPAIVEKKEYRQVDIEKPISNYQNQNKAYQKNVLKSMSLNQTSPIGIVNSKSTNEISKNLSIPEVTTSNSFQSKEVLDIDKNILKSIPVQEATTSNSFQSKETVERNNNVVKSNYLEEISKKMEKSQKEEQLNRTDYELQQEEDAIISYQELLQKKDTIKIEDEEDAVISYEELLSRTKPSEDSNKIYNITDEIENDKFIKELKNFREDLH